MKHMPQLDGLRAIAVMAVLATHTLPESGPDALQPGRAGVRLFFVLSGFLITGILLDARSLPRRRAVIVFYARRSLRIFPLYYAVVLGAAAVDVPEMREELPWHATYLSNVLIARLGRWIGYGSHLWSLSVEEQFYLVWPWVVLYVPRRALPAAFIAAAAVGPASRAAVQAVTDGDLSPRLGLTPCCLDSLCLGAILALFRSGGAVSTGTLAAFAASGAALLAAAIAAPALQAVATDTGLALVSVAIIGGAADGFGGTTGRLLRWQPLAYVGRISYGVYLLHNFVPPTAFRLAARLGLPFPDRGPALFVIVTACSLVGAAACWHLFEAPVLSLKRLLPYRDRRC